MLRKLEIIGAVLLFLFASAVSGRGVFLDRELRHAEADVTETLRALKTATDEGVRAHADLSACKEEMSVPKACSPPLGLRVEEGRPLCDATYSRPGRGRVLVRPGATVVVVPYREGCKEVME